MARVTVEDCLGLVGNQFKLVLIASHRARMLLNSAKPLVKAEGEKPGVIALREISAGLVDESILKQPLGRSSRDSEYPSFLTDPEPENNPFPDSAASTATEPNPSGDVEQADSGDLVTFAASEAASTSPTPAESQEN